MFHVLAAAEGHHGGNCFTASELAGWQSPQMLPMNTAESADFRTVLKTHMVGPRSRLLVQPEELDCSWQCG